MRFALYGLLVLCLIAVITASPASKNKQPPACSRDCSSEKYEPLCAKARNSSRERLITFGSECVMANYNCQHTDDPYEVKSQGECGGNVSVRLS